MLRRAPAACLLALALAGCGSTVQVTGSTATGDPGAAGLGDGGTRSSSAPAQGRAAGSSSTSPAAGTTSAGSTSSLPGNAGPGRASGGEPVPAAPDVRAGKVEIGYTTSTALSGVAGSLGLKGVDPGDTDAQVAAVVQDLNARGGLLGRTVKLLRFDVRAESTQQQACAYFTQDHKAFAVVDSVNVGAPVTNEELAACLSKTRVPLLTGAPLISQLTYQRFPYLVAPDHAASERYMHGLVAHLARTPYFERWDTALGRPGALPVKIGINSFDTPGDRSRAASLARDLKALGHKDVVVVAHPSSPDQLAASTSGAVLRFKSEGVTHVFGASVLFYQNAQSQGYRPRYAVDDTANTVQLMAQNAPASQLHGAIGAGYLPMSEDEDYVLGTSAAKRCLDLMRRAKVDVSNRFAVTYMLNICDRFWTLERALSAGGSLTAAGFLSGLSRVPHGLDGAGTYAISMSGGRRDGAYRLRGFAYVDSCTCFRLSGPVSTF